MSFAGGGTDVPPFPEREGGVVLSSTINRLRLRDPAAAGRRRHHGASLDFGDSIDFGVDEPVVFDGRLDLPKAAIARRARVRGALRQPGFDLFLHTNAPPGSGLGSSSAVVVNVLALVAAHCAIDLTPHELAEVACRLEREDLGIPGGLQDQYAATFGGFNFMEFRAERVVVYPLRVPDATVHELEHNMLLAFTGHTRISDHIIEDQVARFAAGTPTRSPGCGRRRTRPRDEGGAPARGGRRVRRPARRGLDAEAAHVDPDLAPRSSTRPSSWRWRRARSVPRSPAPVVAATCSSCVSSSASTSWRRR